MIKRVVLLRFVFAEIAVSQQFLARNYPEARNIRRMCSDEGLWKKLNSLRLFLKPLKCFIKLCDHQCNTTEHLYPGMAIVKDEWAAEAPPFTVPAAFKNAAVREHTKRWGWMMFDIHRAAYACAPLSTMPITCLPTQR